jgi:hypothetical protein
MGNGINLTDPARAAPSLTYRQVQALSPCEEDFARVAALMGGEDKWGDTPITASQARELGVTFDDILWVATNRSLTDTDVDRRLLFWKADCAARVLHLFERECPADARPRTAIVANRAYARGEISAAAYAAARHEAWEAAAGDAAVRAAAVRAAAVSAASVRAAAVSAAARGAARAAAWATADATADAAADAAAAAGADDAAWDAEEAWQFDRLIARLSDPEPEDIALPELAQAGG